MGTAAEATLWIAVPGMVPFAGSRKGGLAQEGSGGRTTQLRPAANNLAAPGIFFSNVYMSCMYKSDVIFLIQPSGESVSGLTGVVLVFTVSNSWWLCQKVLRETFPDAMVWFLVPQSALTSADRLENKCLKSHNIKFLKYPDTGIGIETVIKHLWPSMEKYVGNYITLECFALNKITCFSLGRGWRGKHCGEIFSQLALVRNDI